MRSTLLEKSYTKYVRETMNGESWRIFLQLTLRFDKVFFGTKSYARINHLHGRALIIVYRTELFWTVKIDKSYNMHEKYPNISSRNL